MAGKFSWIWSEKQHRRWAQTRQKGRWRFILLSGMLGWGGCMFVFMTGVRFLLAFPAPVASTPWYWISNAIVWLVGGFLFGYLTWIFSEKLFQRTDTLKTGGF